MKKLPLWAFTLLLVSLLFLPMGTTTAQLIATLEGHTDNVWSVAFSPDGKMLASGSWDQTVRLWDVETEQLLHILTGHTGEVNSVAFSLDGDTLASGSWDGTIRLWNPNTGKLKRTLTDHRGGIGTIAFSSDGNMLASASADQTVRLWNTTTWQTEKIVRGHSHVVDWVAFSPDSTIVASGSRDLTVRLWNVETEQQIRTLTEHAHGIRGIVFSPDGNTLVTGDHEGTVLLWQPHTGQLKRTLLEKTGLIRPVAFSPDDGTLAIGGQGIRLWDTDTEEYKRPLGGIGIVSSLTFSPDGQIIASGSADNLVRLLESTPPEVPFATIPFDITNIPEPVPPRKEVRDFFDLDSFYQQWINVGGFPVLASAEVSPYAVKEAAWIIYQMIGHRGDILEVLARHRKRLTVLAITESFSNTPEYDRYFNNPTKFLGASYRDINCSCPIALASEENLIYLGTRFHLMIHEFAHVVHEGLNQMGPTFDNRLKTTYEAAMEKGLYSGYYASSNKDEYWAEGAQSWFNASGSNVPKTRAALKTYDPDLAKLLTEIFGDSDWRYTPPETRLHLPHLQELTPEDFPRFYGSPPWEIGAVELEQQLRDPNSDGDGKWVDLKLYHPNRLPSLIESTTRGGDTAFIWVNLTGGEISFYTVDVDGTERWVYTAATKLFYDANTHVGAIWLIKDHKGEDLAVFRAEEKTGRVLIGPAPIELDSAIPFVNLNFDINNIPEPVPPPKEVRDFFDLDPFYQQWINVEGFPILASDKVSPYALKEAAWLIWHMTRHRPDLLQVLGQGRARFSITAHNESASDIPELTEYLVPHFFYNVRGRGGTCPFTCGIVSDSEEVLLGSHTYSVLIHEFTHALHHALNRVDPAFDKRLRTTYDAAMAKGLWADTYAALNRDEYFAEAVGSWFHAAESGNPIKTRDALKTYAPSLASLIAEIFGDYAWRYTPLAMRTHLPHLQGFDPQSAPKIIRPPGELEAYEELYNPAINERDEWVNLPPYDPSLIPILNESRTRGERTDILFLNHSGAKVLLYRVHADGTEILDGHFPPNPRLITQLTTNVGDLLLAKDLDGRNLAVFQAVEKVGRALIGPALETHTTIDENARTESPPITVDVNRDGNVNVLDLVVIASELGNAGTNLAVDVNGDGIVNILDLIMVASMFDGTAAAPSAQPQVPETLTAVEVQGWLTDARNLEVRDPIMKRGFIVVEQLLIYLTPKETELLANYPNPFNPETWIPYRLAEDAFVTLTIYDTAGQVVRTLEVGHRIASAYESRSKAIYWDGRNDIGERVASGVYFYTLSAGDYSATQKMVMLK